MEKRKLTERVSLLGAVDWDRKMFDALIPLPHGTSYNAYLVRGSSKTALLDTVDPPMAGTLMSQLEDVKKIDYVISHHAEQDHSGTIPAVLARYPEAKVICSTDGRDMLLDLLDIAPDRIEAVADGQKLSLGDRSLRFVYTPWVHWPETMSTYLIEEQIFFSCDFFGAHIASGDAFVQDRNHVLDLAKLYYAEIMMPFQPAIAENMKRIAAMKIRMIAPSHGQVYREPQVIIHAYIDWVLGKPKNLVLLPYVTMHESTKRMVEHFSDALGSRGVGVQVFDMTTADVGQIATGLVDARTIIFGTPTVLGGPHPAVANVAFLANALKPKAQFLGVIGSFGWGGRAPEILAGMMRNVKAEVFEPVLCQGFPRAEAFKELNALADLIKKKHALHTL